MKKKTIKWILGIIGIIFLGAVGSGLWQIGIEPASSWILDALFKITTLGLSYFEDAFYRDVAKGLHEETSIFTLYFIFVGFTIFFGYIWSTTSGDRASKFNKFRQRWRGLILKILTIYLFSLLVFQYSTITRRNRIITDFRRRFTIAKSLLDEQEEEFLLSKFSMIKSKQDYLNVNNMLIEMSSKKIQDLKSSSVKDKTEQ